MVLMACPCLNVRVHGKGPTPFLQDVTYLHLSDGTAADSFFSPSAYVVTLDLGGVTRAQNLLCRDRFVDGWTVTTCICCAFDIYAQYADDHDRVLVSNSAQKDSNHVSNLMESHRYSRLFKLVLPEINDNFIQNNIGIELQNSNLDSSIEHVQTQVSNYLKDEQKAMEERIRKYTEIQQSNYADLLQRVRKHKQSMVYLLLKSKEEKASNQNGAAAESPRASPAAPLNKDAANESSTSTDSAFDRSDASEHSHERVRKQNARSLRRSMSNPARSANKTKKGLKRPPANIDVGGVFDMEEFDSKEEYSNDEDTDDSETSNVEDSAIEKSEDRMMCATSLPMSIPAFSQYSHFSVMDDEEDDYKNHVPKDPEQIAASMRALACSVRDGTEMFGELPRRRLNTGELLSSRPL